jgi:UDP-N-acetylglucosamine 2-epimerase
MAKVIRMTEGIHTVRNLPPARFLKLLTQCSALVGNSSAGIREASYLGTPVINIGSRQTGPGARTECAGCAEWRAVSDDSRDLRSSDAWAVQIVVLYGKGDAGERIAEVLCGR